MDYPRLLAQRDSPAVEVNELVMELAHQDEVVEVGGPAPLPRPYVVAVDVTLVLAAGEGAAVAIAVPELTLERLGHVAGGPAQPDNVTLVVVQNGLDAGVTAQHRGQHRVESAAALALPRPPPP